MIEYRKLPKGNELIGKLGLGMGGIPEHHARRNRSGDT